MSESTQRFIEINGAKHLVDVQGEGPSLLFIHAGIADLRMWDAVFEPLAQSHRAIRFDMRGYGQSALSNAPFSYLDDLTALLEHFEVRDVVLIGCSFGGQIAIDCAIEHPEIVSGLVLVSPVVRGWSWSDQIKAFGAKEDELLDAGDLDGAVDLNIETWVIGHERQRADVDAKLIERVAEMQRRAFEVQTAVPDAQVSFPNWLAIDNLDDISAPTLLISGVHDVEDIHSIAHLLKDEIAGAKHISLMGTAHMIPMERPDAFLQYAAKFLRGLR